MQPGNASDNLGSATTLLRGAITQVAAAMRHMRFDLHVPTERFTVSLLLAVLDYARGTIVLVDAGLNAALPHLVRSAMDAYVDICNLCDRPNYWEVLLAADTHTWNRLLRNASRGGNTSLLPIANNQHFEELRAHYGQVERSLSKRGIKKPNIDTRFEMAGLADAHESAYHILSAKIHNTVSVTTYLYTDMATEPPALRDCDPLPGQAIGELYMCTEALLKSAEKVLRRLGHGRAAISGAWREFRQLASELGVDIEC